jgi:hypothetical protein
MRAANNREDPRIASNLQHLADVTFHFVLSEARKSNNLVNVPANMPLDMLEDPELPERLKTLIADLVVPLAG